MFSFFYGKNTCVHREEAVTLIELIVVLGIIALLATIAIPEFVNFRERASRQNAVDAAKELANAMAMYRTDFGDYPSEGEVDILGMYTEVTRFRRNFNFNLAISPYLYTGVMIYDPLTAERCIYGIVNNLTPEYRVTYCLESSGTDPNTQTGPEQPTCCWARGGVDCTVDSNWYPCTSGM
jgi:type II secretory pathway pseudopilin PulG